MPRSCPAADCDDSAGVSLPHFVYVSVLTWRVTVTILQYMVQKHRLSGKIGAKFRLKLAGTVAVWKR